MACVQAHTCLYLYRPRRISCMPLLESLLGVLLMYSVPGMRTYAALAHGARMKDISFILEADCLRRFWLRKPARKRRLQTCALRGSSGSSIASERAVGLESAVDRSFGLVSVLNMGCCLSSSFRMAPTSSYVLNNIHAATYNPNRISTPS